MNLLAAKLYDPAGAVSKATSALLAITAFDTTNLRNAVTVPAHGMLRVRIACAIHGAATCPQILLGVLDGATVRGRAAPTITASNLAATTIYQAEVDFVITGLTPGAMNLDAAYGVETVVASTNIKYGGPNNTTANDAFGAFVFEVWDPQPLQVSSTALQIDASGRVDVGKVAGTTQTAGDICARLPAALVSGRMDASVGAMAANVLTASAIASDAITDAKVASDVTIASVTGAVGSVTGNVGGNVAGSVASVTAAVTLPAIPNNWITAAGINAGALNGKGDWLLASGYTAPPSAAAVADAVWDELIAGHLGAGSTGLQLSLAGAGGGLDAAGVRAALGLASANLDAQLADLAVIRAKTDSLTFTVPGKLDVNLLVVNGITVTGSGTPGSPWGPAP